MYRKNKYVALLLELEARGFLTSKELNSLLKKFGYSRNMREKLQKAGVITLVNLFGEKLYIVNVDKVESILMKKW